MAQDTTDKTRIITGAQPQNLEEQTLQRAFELYEARGREDGHELDDWLRAEKSLNRTPAPSPPELISQITNTRASGPHRGFSFEHIALTLCRGST